MSSRTCIRASTSACILIALLALPLGPARAADIADDSHLRAVPRSAAETARIAGITRPGTDFSAPEPFEANPGGAATVRRRTDREAFSLPQANLDFAQRSTFNLGNGLFERNWVEAPASTIASDGLGPMFNTRSCQSCHIKDGRGHAPVGPQDDAASMVVRLGRPDPSLATELEHYLGAAPDPVYGHQFSDHALLGLSSEGTVRVDWEEAGGIELDGETVHLRRPVWMLDDLSQGPLSEDTAISPRVAPSMIGLGLIEAIPAADILAHADPDDFDGDGISGRPNVVWSPEYDRPMLGRFGVRATTPTLRQQAADAFNADMGLSSPLRPDAWGDCTEAQADCRSRPDGGDAAQDGFEVAQASLDLVTFYAGTLAVPARADVDDPAVLAGKAAFAEAGCQSCHVPKFVTQRLEDRPEHSFQLVWPHSDFLLHDMGPGLADGLPAGSASGSEWRTTPLWGLGLTQDVSPEAGYLHDGRARTLSEAILWHGGEGQAARDAFAAMPRDVRADLLAYLESL